MTHERRKRFSPRRWQRRRRGKSAARRNSLKSRRSITAALEKVTLEKKLLKGRFLPKDVSGPPPSWRPAVDLDHTMEADFNLDYHLTVKYPNDTSMHPKLEKITYVREEEEYTRTLNQAGRRAASKTRMLFDSVHGLARRCRGSPALQDVCRANQANTCQHMPRRCVSARRWVSPDASRPA